MAFSYTGLQLWWCWKLSNLNEWMTLFRTANSKNIIKTKQDKDCSVCWFSSYLICFLFYFVNSLLMCCVWFYFLSLCVFPPVFCHTCLVKPVVLLFCVSLVCSMSSSSSCVSSLWLVFRVCIYTCVLPFVSPFIIPAIVMQPSLVFMSFPGCF